MFTPQTLLGHHVEITLLKANSCYICWIKTGQTAPEITWISLCTLAADVKGSFPKTQTNFKTSLRGLPPPPLSSPSLPMANTHPHTSETLNSLKEVQFRRVNLGVVVVVCVHWPWWQSSTKRACCLHYRTCLIPADRKAASSFLNLQPQQQPQTKRQPTPSCGDALHSRGMTNPASHRACTPTHKHKGFYPQSTTQIHTQTP